MDGKTIEQRKAEYQGSTLQALMEANNHEVCERCYCCDAMWESTPCFQCGGFEDDPEDGFPPDVCSACGGNGEIEYRECIGRCDEQGNHKARTGAYALESGPAEGGEATRSPDGRARESVEKK